MDVNKLLRDMANDSSVVDTWNDEEKDAVLARMGVDVDQLKDQYENGPKSPELETLLALLCQRPELIDTVPVPLMDGLLRYLGGRADPADVLKAFREAGVSIDKA